MKYRAGYVSNSSSSSFIVAFPHVPKDVDDVRQILFGDSETFSSPYGDECWGVKEVASIVFDDIKKQKPNDFSSLVDSLRGGWFEGALDFNHDCFKNKDGEIDWGKYEAANLKVVEKIALDFAKENKGSALYVFHYEDDTRIGSAMEQGGLFDSLEHKKTSYH